MDGGADRVAGSGALCCRQTFRRRPHLTDADYIGMLTQNPLQKKVLVDVQSRILAGAGQQVNDRIQDVAVFVSFDQIKLTAAFLDGYETLVVGYIGEQPGHDGSLAGTRGTGDAYTDAVPNTGHQKMKHLSRGAAGIQKFLFRDRLLVDDTDGGIDANIRVHDRCLIHGNTDVLIQKSNHAGHRIVDDHAAGVEHTPYHINGVLRRRELIRDFDAAAAGLDHLNVIVGIDIDFFDAGLVDPFLQKGVPGHIFIELLAKLLGGQPADSIFAFDDVLHHQFFQQGRGPLGIGFASFGNGGCVILSKIPLHILQHLVIGQLLIGGRRKEYVIEVIHRHLPPRTRPPRQDLPLRPVPPTPSAPVRPAPC